MNKIPTIFVRDDHGLLTEEREPRGSGTSCCGL